MRYNIPCICTPVFGKIETQKQGRRKLSMTNQKTVQRWLERAVSDPDLGVELHEIAGNAEAVEDRFYRELEFGTGGLRGVIGAGTNRMNVYVVGKATQGLANYIIKQNGQ